MMPNQLYSFSPYKTETSAPNLSLNPKVNPGERIITKEENSKYVFVERKAEDNRKKK